MLHPISFCLHEGDLQNLTKAVSAIYLLVCCRRRTTVKLSNPVEVLVGCETSRGVRELRRTIEGGERGQEAVLLQERFHLHRILPKGD